MGKARQASVPAKQRRRARAGAAQPAAEDGARAEAQAKIAATKGEVVHDGMCQFDVPIGTRIQRVIFRVPDLEDLAEIDQDVPLLPVGDELKAEADADAPTAMGKIMSDPKQLQVFMKRANLMLIATAIEPRLVARTRLAPEDGTLAVRAIRSQDRVYIFLVLTGLAGYTAKAAAEIAPFVEANGSS